MCPDDVISRTGECNVNCINSSYLMLNENHIGEPAVIAEDFVWTNATLLIRSPCSLMARASNQGWGCRGCKSYLEFWSWQATIITKKFYGLVKCKETNPLIPITEAFCEPHRFFWKKEKKKGALAWFQLRWQEFELNLAAYVRSPEMSHWYLICCVSNFKWQNCIYIRCCFISTAEGTSCV